MKVKRKHKGENKIANVIKCFGKLVNERTMRARKVWNWLKLMHGKASSSCYQD